MAAHVETGLRDLHIAGDVAEVSSRAGGNWTGINPLLVQA